MKTISRFPHATLLAVLAAGTLAGGCGESGLDDLRQYVTEVNQRKAPSPEPLPPIKPYHVYTYAGDERDPFEPFFRQQEAQAQGTDGDSGVAPDFNRNREELEVHPLDSLRMVGTLERDQDVWALVPGVYVRADQTDVNPSVNSRGTSGPQR